MNRNHATLAALTVATLAACKGGGGGIDAAYFGNTVEPPKGLAKIRPGMTLEEAKTAAPSLKEGKGRDEGDWLVASGNDDIRLQVGFDGDRVDRVVVKAKTKDLEPVLTKAWGAPTRETAKYSEEEHAVWKNEAGAWKATLDCLERMCFLDFESYRPLAAAWFGAKPVPPGKYADVRVGMPADEAAKILGDAQATEKYVEAGPDDTRIIAQTSSDDRKVTSVRLMLPADALPLLEQAWGPGLESEGLMGKPNTSWFDAASGWRAMWEGDSMGDSGSLEFENYLPLEQIVGAGPADLALFEKAGLGATATDLATAYGARWDAKDEVITLPPAPWGELWTRVNVGFGADGKVAYLRFGIPYSGYVPAHDEILGAFRARFGEPKPVEDLGRTNLQFKDAPPLLVYDETITSEWQVTYGTR
jgi:hypothetical protein